MEFDILDSLDDLGNSVSTMEIACKEQRCNLLKEDNVAFLRKSVSTMKIACKEQRCNLQEEDIIAFLRYSGPLKTDEAITDAIDKGTKCIEFTQLVEWLSKELQSLYDMESCVNALTDPDDSSSFLLEVSSFLKEMHCPYKSLQDGPISQRLLDVQSRRTLLDYLCTEVQTARVLYSKKTVKNYMEIEVDDSSTALSLYKAINALGIEEDFSSNPISCFTEIENKVKSIIESHPGCIVPAILTEMLTEKQWESLNNLYHDLFTDYTTRRDMLLTRLDVTIQSFKWGEGSKSKENKILEAYMPRRKRLKTKPDVKLSDILAARESLLIIEKTSSDELVKNTKSSLNRILIPAVPDRGGRPKEQRPPVEMPNWMKRNAGGGRGDHHGGGNWRGKGKKFRGNQSGGGGKSKERDRGGSFDAAGSY